MLVKEVMSPQPERISPELSLQHCARIMRDQNIGSLLVWDNGELLGLVTDRDICCRAVAEGADMMTLKAKDIMSTKVEACFDDDDCLNAAHTMGEKHVRRLAVLNRTKDMVGLLSVSDLAKCSHGLAGEVLEAASPPYEMH